MGLFGNYQNAGPGINPHAPKKKPFFRFWEVLWRNFGKLISLNLLITLFHTPVLLSLIFYMETDNKFTVPMVIFLLIVQFVIEGPMLAGCARVLRLIVLDKAFFFAEEFKKDFSRNFGASLLYWTIDTVMIASISSGAQVWPALAKGQGSNAYYLPLGISIAAGLVLLFMNFYIFPLQTATTLKKSSVLKNSFQLTALSFKHCLISLGGILLMLGICFLIMMINGYLMLLFAFFPAAFIGFLTVFVHYPVIQKYVIRPYYESTGEKNPEEEEESVQDEDEERIFTDRGTTEKAAKTKTAKKGKVIS